MAAVVGTTAGTLRGVVEGDLAVFRGVPYAKPPVGDLRFRPPQPMDAWQGEREATAFGTISVQADIPMAAMMGGGEPDAEDCLYLNVWTPGLDAGRRPVMVWLHGGAFIFGSGSSAMYAGTSLAQRGDVVVVTINYRLGALGYLAHPDLVDAETGAMGNWGLLDQIAALEWVRDNIEHFGGDPGNVMVFGESAGSMSTSNLLAAPRAKGLFHKAICQSGAPMAMPAEDATRVANLLVESLGLSSIEEVRTAPVKDIVAAQTAVMQSASGELVMPFEPTIDGVVLPASPWELIAAGSAAGVTLMMGSNRDEMKLFSMLDPEAMGLDDAALVARLTARLGDDAQGAVDAYRKAREGRGESAIASELWWAMESDRFFRAPAMHCLHLHAEHAPATYAYLITWESPMAMLGSCHAIELPLVFGTLDAPGASMLSGEGEAAETLATLMQDAWIAFAHRGDPSTPGLGSWPVYTAATRETMVLGTACGVETAPREDERRVWEARADALPSFGR
ncbi:MAG: carboxylesterase/lipase family protein [Acidimicrobiales bacterium]